MQVMEPEKLEIQLGADWAGVEFQLKTDSGMYPGTIAVGEDGVLRMELGGSKSYVLTCMNSSVSAPEATQAPATTEEAQNESNESQERNGSNSGQDTKGTVAGIPVLHLVLFAGGMVLAVGSLVAMRVMKNVGKVMQSTRMGMNMRMISPRLSPECEKSPKRNDFI